MTTATKPFSCPEAGCDWTGKTQGSLTAHAKNKHGDGKLASVRAKYGTSAPRPGGAWKKDTPLRAAPSGVPSIDYAIGIGGVPRGCLIEIFGPPKIGKTFTAMTFSAHAQSVGGKAGYLDVENAMQATFLELIPHLDVDALEFGTPANGEEALNMTKDFVKSKEFDVWTIDSLHACLPASVLDQPIGSPQSRAALARLLSEGLPVLEHVAADTPTAVILVNHQKVKPGVSFGREWYTPGGSAPEYYSSVRLRVWSSGTYQDAKSGQRIGHRVKVKVEASKVGAPFATAEYDLIYKAGVRKDTGQEVVPGVDIPSAWLSVLMEEGRVTRTGSGIYIDVETGEKLGEEVEVKEMLADEGAELREFANKIVYPEIYR